MPLKKINGSEIEYNMTEQITIVNFYANWCGPCKMMIPVFEEIATQDGITVLKVDIDHNREFAQKYGVKGIPATFVYKNKQLKFQETGYMPKTALTEKIAKI